MMNFSYRLEKVIPVDNTLGEGVLWRPSDQTIWWIDIQERSLYCLKWGSEKPKQYILPQRLCSFGFVAGRDDLLVAGFETGFAYYHHQTGEIDWVYQPEELRMGGGRRLNDGRVGPDGAFWVSSMMERDDVPGGETLTGTYRFAGGKIAPLVHSGLRIGNGLCWSPDGTRIYLSDSPKGKIFQASFDANSGACGKFQAFAETEGGEPDGGTTDSVGNYWSALWGGHRVACYDSNGNEIAKLKMQVPQPTIPVFGGPELNHLIVTSACDGLNEEEHQAYPSSGHVFVYETNVTGVGPHYFNKTSC